MRFFNRRQMQDFYSQPFTQRRRNLFFKALAKMNKY